MNPKIMKRWVKALRSGKYKQGKQRLKTLNGQSRFCCLGVLCDLHSKTASGEKWVDDVEEKEGSYCGMEGVLPKKVRKWAGLGDGDPTLLETGSLNSASELNDHGKRFSTIAKLIEQAQKKKLI